jgi:hypothetical protein
MAKRKQTLRVASTEVQGAGSYVEFAPMTYGESKAVIAKADGLSDVEKVAFNERLLTEKIMGWDWVDNDDNLLPLPKDDPTVFERLTSWEINFLNEAFRDGNSQKKGSGS